MGPIPVHNDSKAPTVPGTYVSQPLAKADSRNNAGTAATESSFWSYSLSTTLTNQGEIFRLISRIALTVLFMFGLSISPAMAFQQGGGPGTDWDLKRPLAGTEYPETTRSVGVVGFKPPIFAADIRVEDPRGNITHLIIPAIRPFFFTTISAAGHKLETGTWEVTLTNALNPDIAHDQTSFEVVAGAGDESVSLPTIEVPPPGEFYPDNIPYVIFSGAANDGNQVYLRLINELSGEEVFTVKVWAVERNNWGYLAHWLYGIGKWKASVYAADPDFGGIPTGSTNFETVSRAVEPWPTIEASYKLPPRY